MSVGVPVLVGSGTGFNQVIPAGGVAQGSYLVLAFNHVGGGITSISDTRGNTYTLLRSKTQTSGAIVHLYGAPVTTALQSGDTISVTPFGSPSATTHIVVSISGVAQASTLDVGADNGGTGTSLSTGTTAASTLADSIAMAGFGATGGTTSYAGPFTKITQVAASGFAISLGYRVLTATGTQQATATIGSSETWAGAIVVLKGVTPVFTDLDTVKLALTPSTSDIGPYSDAAVGLLKLTASGTESQVAHTLSDAATVPIRFKITPDETATVRLQLTPSAEDAGPITDAATAKLLFTPFGTPGAREDVSTVRLALTPSGIDTFHQCKPRFAGTLEGWSTAPDDDHFYKTWLGSLVDRQWQAELLPMEAVVNHPC